MAKIMNIIRKWSKRKKSGNESEYTVRIPKSISRKLRRKKKF